MATKWNFVTLMEEAAKYRNRSDFIAGNQYAYGHAKIQGLLDYMFPKHEGKLKWTIEALTTEVAKYHTRTDFANGNRYAYRQAAAQGLLDHLYPPKEKIIRLPAPSVVRYERAVVPSSYVEPPSVQIEVDRLCKIMDDRWAQEALEAIANGECTYKENEFFNSLEKTIDDIPLEVSIRKANEWFLLQPVERRAFLLDMLLTTMPELKGKINLN